MSEKSKYSYFMHPNKNCMSYYKHWKLSLYYSRRMFMASIKAIVHAFLPNYFITSTTNTINEIQLSIKENGCDDNNIIVDHQKKYHEEVKIQVKAQANVPTIIPPTTSILPLSVQKWFYKSSVDTQNT